MVLPGLCLCGGTPSAFRRERPAIPPGIHPPASISASPPGSILTSLPASPHLLPPHAPAIPPTSPSASPPASPSASHPCILPPPPQHPPTIAPGILLSLARLPIHPGGVGLFQLLVCLEAAANPWSLGAPQVLVLVGGEGEGHARSASGRFYLWRVGARGSCCGPRPNFQGKASHVDPPLRG